MSQPPQKCQDAVRGKGFEIVTDLLATGKGGRTPLSIIVIFPSAWARTRRAVVGNISLFPSPPHHLLVNRLANFPCSVHGNWLAVKPNILLLPFSELISTSHRSIRILLKNLPRPDYSGDMCFCQEYFRRGGRGPGDERQCVSPSSPADAWASPSGDPDRLSIIFVFHRSEPAMCRATRHGQYL